MNEFDRQTEFKKSFPEISALLSESYIVRLLNISQRVEFSAGRKIIKDQQPVEHLYMIMSGKLEAVVDDGNQEKVVGVIGAGEIIGEVSLLSGAMTASSSVVTASKVVALKMSHQAFMIMLNDGDHLANSILQLLIIRLERRLESARERLLNISQSGVNDKRTASAGGLLSMLLGLRY